MNEQLDLAQEAPKVFAEFIPERAETAHAQWLEWLGDHPRAGYPARVGAIMCITADVAEITIRNYRHELRARNLRVGIDVWRLLNAVAERLGETTRRPPVRPGPRRLPALVRRIALLTELDELPSANFHFTLISYLIREASARHLSLTVVPTHQNDLVRALPFITGMSQPDGVILLRLTPSPEPLETLRREYTPVVLIHANMLEYRKPVIANVMRGQESLGSQVRGWVESRVPADSGGGPSTVVLVATPEEEEPLVSYPPLDADAGVSMRNQRRKLVSDALAEMAGIRAETVEVKDYSFHRAAEVYRRQPDAAAYICLSDQIAVALKHLLVAGGKPWEGRIVGFDNTDLARSEGISSFDQELQNTAHLAIDRLARCFSREPFQWPAFEALRTTVTLDRRDG